MKRDKPTPPKHLSDAAKKLWRQLVTEYLFDVPDTILILQTALECHDRAEEARRMIERDGAVILDRFNQKKAHPATVIERDSRMSMLRSFSALGLDVVKPGPIGRPPGR